MEISGGIQSIIKYWGMIYYYIMVDPDKPHRCKLGITGNIQGRLRAYKTANPSCYFLQTYSIPDRVHERRILSIIKDRFTVRSEYVHCSPLLVRNIVEGYFLDNDINF